MVASYRGLETKIKGKGELVETYCMERHVPHSPMVYIRTVTNHGLFCQTNHPLFIERDGKIIELECAGDVRVNKDKIWVDNEITKNSNQIKPRTRVENVISCIVDVVASRDVSSLKNVVELRGKDDKTFRFEPDFINYCTFWLNSFIDDLCGRNVITFRSYNMASQINLICNKVNRSCHIRLLEKGNDLFFVTEIGKQEVVPVYKGYFKISDATFTENWKSYVYDVKTSSNEYMCGCVQNHNTFHLGGAVILKSINVTEEIMDNTDEAYRKQVISSLEQKGDDLFNRSDFAMIRVDKSIYIKPNDFKEEDNHYIFPVGHFTLMLDGLEVNVTIEKEVIIYKSDDQEEDDKYLNITYTKNDKIITVKPAKEDFSKLAQQLDGLVGGKSPWADVPGLYKKFFKSLSIVGGWDSVHLEVAISNILRSKRDLQKPARLLEPFDPTMVSIKTLPSIISWPLGLSFENFSRAISVGMVSERGPESPIEKVMFGSKLTEK